MKLSKIEKKAIEIIHKERKVFASLASTKKNIEKYDIAVVQGILKLKTIGVNHE